jgi:hypothetical protein
MLAIATLVAPLFVDPIVRRLYPQQLLEVRMLIKHVLGAAVSVTGLAAIIVAGTTFASPALRADDDDHASSENAEIERGLQTAPVPLTYRHADRKLVGLGSYLVNTFDCNGCHSAGPATYWNGNHNPYLRVGIFTPPAEVNPATYLGGGRDFGQVGPVTSATIPPHIISRNLTPDSTGLPEQGAEFGEFFDSVRRGIDHDHLHPNCNGTTITDNCFNPPFDGDKLQVMPWPTLQNLTDRDLLAIYEYLKAIPCIASPGHSC